jgi:DNA-binding PadR family transcriptional regulator
LSEAANRGSDPLSALDFHVLLVLATADLYGYAIMKAIEAQSLGAVSPEIGSLYRVLGRLMNAGRVMEVNAPEHDAELHRGRPRRYYRITQLGRAALENEADRLRHVVSIANQILPEAPR